MLARLSIASLFIVTLCALPASVPCAQRSYPDVRLTPSDASAEDHFGEAVALDGETALIGAVERKGYGSDFGKAYVFVRDAGSWIEQARLVAPDGIDNDDFGHAVALHRDTAIVTAYADDGGRGSAYVFVRGGTAWSLQAKLTAPDAAPGDLFGQAVALDGDTAIVTASRDDVGAGSGSAYVFERTGATWNLSGKLYASDAGTAYSFGESVSLFADTAVIGSLGVVSGSISSGAAYVFVRTGTTWTEEARLRPLVPDDDDRFAYSVSVDADRLVAGARGSAGGGAAYLFGRTGTTWAEERKLLPGDPDQDHKFGEAVAIRGDLVVVGDPGHDLGGGDRGAAYLFRRGGSSWFQAARLRASDGGTGHGLGSAVAVDTLTTLAGGSYASFVAHHSGATHAFRNGLAGTATFRNDSGSTNPTGYTASPARLGVPWTATVDNSGMNNTLAGVFGYAQPTELFLPLVGEYLLVDTTSPGGDLLHLSLRYGVGPVSFSLDVPGDPAFAGYLVSTQGAGFGGTGSINLHNAVDLVVGY